jgi:thioredoxin 1
MKKGSKKLLAVILLVAVWLEVVGQGKKLVLNADDFQAQIASLSDEQIVDVRTAEEFEKGFINGALNVNINSPEFRSQVSALDKSRPVLVYCLSGSRSTKAAEYMRKEGFVAVYELKGGLVQWNSKRKPLTVKKPASPGMSSATFEKQLNGEKLVLVDFHAPWCAPCIKMAPELQSLQDEYKSKLILLKVNADNNRKLMDSLKIQAIPALIIFKNGQQVWSSSGLIEKEKVRSEIVKNL